DTSATASSGGHIFTSRPEISLGAGASSETRKNGIPNRRVRGPRNAPLPHIAVCSAGTGMRRDDAPRRQARPKPESPHMDDTIDHSIVFAKTPKGVAEINARSGALTLQARRVLIMIDGHRPVSELMAVV